MNGRRNNVADMTISEQVAKIKTEVCDKCCRWPQYVHEMWLREEIEDRDEYLEDAYCKSCPLTRL